jgi:hypothetical protein
MPSHRAPKQVGRHLAGLRQLILQRQRAIENVFDQRGRDSDRVAETLRQIEDETVRRRRGGGQCLFGAIALAVRLLLFAVGQDAGPGCGDRENKEKDRSGRYRVPSTP